MGFNSVFKGLKSVPWKPSCSVQTDERMNMTMLIVAFRNFANAPKKWILINEMV